MEIRIVCLLLAWIVIQQSHFSWAWTHRLASQKLGSWGRQTPPAVAPARRSCRNSRAPPMGVHQSPRFHEQIIVLWAEGSTRGGPSSWAFANASTELLELVESQQQLNGGASGSSDVQPSAAPAEQSSSSPFLLQRRRITHSPDQVAKTTLGDIMSMGLITGTTGPSTARGVTAADDHGPTTEETLAQRYGIYHPLDRMALTANGNLQRLICSYYDSPVSVTLDRQYRQQMQQTLNPDRDEGSSTRMLARGSPPPSLTSSAPTSHVWHRVVHLSVFGQTFCTATSVITVHDPTCQALVESGQVGLGQLFRYLDLLPEFTLLGAGPLEEAMLEADSGPATSGRPQAHESDRSSSTAREGGGNFWREYRLDCNELSCRIREEFCPGLWELRPPCP